MLPLTYSYNTQVLCTTETNPFSLTLKRKSPGALVSENKTTPEEYITMPPVQAKLKVLKNRELPKRRAERVP